ncbi:hypothetical protein ACFQJ7_14620 [Halovenus rubra]|uniref:Uncharacterized protein n=2 Tax=Halovenus rubra TaxID=869890 RepID=A0ACC7DYE1_9EURY|nr:hypothetical protein [Halovenus rubra]
MVRRTTLLAGFCVGVAVLAVVDVQSVHPTLDATGDIVWTVLFWVLLFVVLALLVWQIFPTPSR